MHNQYISFENPRWSPVLLDIISHVSIDILFIYIFIQYNNISPQKIIWHMQLDISFKCIHCCYLISYGCTFYERIEDTKGVIKWRKSKKNSQHIDQVKKKDTDPTWNGIVPDPLVTSVV